MNVLNPFARRLHESSFPASAGGRAHLRIGPVELWMPRRGNPAGHDCGELLSGVSGVRGADDLQEAWLAARGDSLHVALEHAFERLLLVPLGMLWGERLHPVKGEGYLEVDGLLRPERAVVVERGDPLGGRHEVPSRPPASRGR